MRRKNWAIPGFLVLVMLLLLSFPATAFADESGTPSAVAGGEVTASPQPSAPVNATPVSDNQPTVNQAEGQASEPPAAEPDPADVPASGDAAPANQGQEDPVPAPDNPAPVDGDKVEDPAPTSEEPVLVPDATADKGSGGEIGVTPPCTPTPGGELPDGGDTVKPQPPINLVPEVIHVPEVIPVLEVIPTPEVTPVPVVTVPAPVVVAAPAPVVVVTTAPVVVAPIPVSDTVYVVQPGDTLEKISQETGVSVERIKRVNGLAVAGNSIAEPKEDAAEKESAAVVPTVTYKVRIGESLWLIGRTLGIAYQEIMKANNITDHLIYPDQELRIPGLESENGVIKYLIKKGDTLYFIGKALGISWEDIMSLNGLTDIWIYPDQEFLMPDKNRSSLYKVQEGDTLAGVAEKFDVDAEDITGHEISGHKLYVGQVLIIPREPSAGSGIESILTAIEVVGTDLEILARAIYGEARGELYEGQVAVGAVIMNRLKTAGYPKSIRDIVYQPGAFTAVDDGQINLTPDALAYRAAEEAMNGADPSLGAVYYWNPDTATSEWVWTRPIIKQIGNHVFAR